MQKRQAEHQWIRPARETDAGRIAEMIVINYRVNFYPFFRNYAYYFGAGYGKNICSRLSGIAKQLCV